jgi:hypothetical protein
MKEYVSLPEALIDDAKALRGWLRRSLEYAAALPPKKPAAAKKGTARKAPTSRVTKKGTASRARATT